MIFLGNMRRLQQHWQCQHCVSVRDWWYGELVSTVNTGSNRTSVHHYCSAVRRRLNFGIKLDFLSSESVLFGVFRVFWGVLQSHWKAVSSKKRIVAQKSRIVAQKTRIVAVKGRWPAGRRWLPILRSMRLRVAVVVSCWTMRKEVAEIAFTAIFMCINK